MPYTIKEYEEIQSDPIPYITKWGTEIDFKGGLCPDCMSPLDNIKFIINEYVDYCVIRSVGMCPECNVTVTCHPFKMTKGGACYCFLDNMWIPLRPKLFGFLKVWIKKLIKYIGGKK